MPADVKRWTLNSISAALGAILGAGGVFVAVILGAAETKNTAELGAKSAKENAEQIVQLNKVVVESIRDLTAKIEAQNQQAVAIAIRVGAAEKSSDASQSLISSEIRPQIQALRESMVRSQSDVSHLSDGIRELKEMLTAVSKELREKPR